MHCFIFVRNLATPYLEVFLLLSGRCFPIIFFFLQDVDNLVDLLMEPWHTVRLNFEDHARFLFREFCGVHRVLQEATFANDEGNIFVSYQLVHALYALFCNWSGVKKSEVRYCSSHDLCILPSLHLSSLFLKFFVSIQAWSALTRC